MRLHLSCYVTEVLSYVFYLVVAYVSDSSLKAYEYKHPEPMKLTLLNCAELVMNLFIVTGNTLQLFMMLKLTQPIRLSDQEFDKTLRRYVSLPVYISIVGYIRKEATKDVEKYSRKQNLNSNLRMYARDALIADDVYREIAADGNCYTTFTEQIALTFIRLEKQRNNSINDWTAQEDAISIEVLSDRQKVLKDYRKSKVHKDTITMRNQAVDDTALLFENRDTNALLLPRTDRREATERSTGSFGGMDLAQRSETVELDRSADQST